MRGRLIRLVLAVVILACLWAPNPIASHVKSSSTGPIEEVSVLGLFGYHTDQTLLDARRLDKGITPGAPLPVADIMRSGYTIREKGDDYVLLSRVKERKAATHPGMLTLTVVLSIGALFLAKSAFAIPKPEESLAQH